MRMRLDRGVKIADFTIGERLGIGSLAVVYAAENHKTSQSVAFKLLSRGLAFNAYARANLMSELELIVRLAHPGIVPIYRVGQYREQVYIVSQLMTNGSLASRVGDDDTLPLAVVKGVIEAIAPALDDAHAQGIVHGNLKPENILFDEANRPKISDFGLGQMANANSGLLRGQSLQQVYHASPEQIADEFVDGRSDIYSLGVMLFHLLEGRYPYSSYTPATVAKMHCVAPIPQVGNELDSLYASVLAKRPDERPASVAELLKLIPDTVSPRKKLSVWQRYRQGKQRTP